MSKILAVLDIETDPFKEGRVPEPFLVGIKWKDNQIKFDNIAAACEFLRRHKFRCYAHNGGKFDYMYFLKYLSAGTNLKLISGRLAEFKLGDSTMRDSYCRYPMPLKSHRKLEIDYDKLEVENREANWQEINDYLDEDLSSLYDLMEYGEKTYGKDLTLASTAMKFWAKQNSIEPPRSNPAYYATFFPFYFGGRVDAPKLGIFEQSISVYDINSAYPFAMKHLHPWGQKYEVFASLPASEIEGRDFVVCEAPSLGYWPFKGQKGLEVFPRDGELRDFHITGWEFLAVQEFHPEMPCKIKQVIKFQASIEFNNYVEHFYALKKSAEKNSPEYLFAKLMMNSLYGKLGACPGVPPDSDPGTPTNYQEYIIAPAEDYLDWEDTSAYKLADIIQPWALLSKDISEEAQHYYDVACAASITGFPRAYLLTALVRNFGRNFHEHPNYFYCDTDGVHSATDQFRVPVGSALGEWNIEFEGVRNAYYGPKGYALLGASYQDGDYAAKNGKTFKTACKGVRISPEQIFLAASGEQIEWKNPAPTMSVRGGVKFMKRRVKRKDFKAA